MQLAKPNDFLPGTGQATEYFIAAAGLIWIFCGALVLGLSASTTPELIACLAFSFGVMFLGLSALLGHLRTLNATSRSVHFSGSPPPVPLEYAIPIEDAINSARAAARPAWIRSFDAFDLSRRQDNLSWPHHADHFAGQAALAQPPQLTQQELAIVKAAYNGAPAADRSTAIVNNAGSVTHNYFSFPAPGQYFREMLPASLPAPTELVEIGGEYYVGPTRTSDEATALSQLQQIFSD